MDHYYYPHHDQKHLNPERRTSANNDDKEYSEKVSFGIYHTHGQSLAMRQ